MYINVIYIINIFESKIWKTDYRFEGCNKYFLLHAFREVQILIWSRTSHRSGSWLKTYDAWACGWTELASGQVKFWSLVGDKALFEPAGVNFQLDTWKCTLVKTICCREKCRTIFFTFTQGLMNGVLGCLPFHHRCKHASRDYTSGDSQLRQPNSFTIAGSWIKILSFHIKGHYIQRIEAVRWLGWERFYVRYLKKRLYLYHMALWIHDRV